MTREQQLAQLNIDANFYISGVARERGYDDAVSCLSYWNSTTTKWKSEAETFSGWRDASWAIINTTINGLSPSDPIPSIDDIVALLPVIVWPN